MVEFNLQGEKVVKVIEEMQIGKLSIEKDEYEPMFTTLKIGEEKILLSPAEKFKLIHALVEEY